ncbi:MAG: GTP-binding protein [Candidatus Lokiarchaeota archaeon]|nr:GTP-binding protein [Candidatus Lokiarchaeota archaeon]MBD3200740.1 GTP-binding protein [Candidatus Lokiarchaeota archaeon]
MLYNIFLLKGKNIKDLSQLNIFSYPNDLVTIEKKDLLRNIIYDHDHEELINNCREQNKKSNLQISNLSSTNQYQISEPIPQLIDSLNIYTTCVNQNISIGLIFEKDDNPYDYKDIFLELLHDFLNSESNFSFEDDIEIENLLLTLFIGIRRYGDEIIEKTPELEYHYQEEFFIKVFLFGIDEVGKTSFVRRIKTGKYSDNYFTPTRKFNIEYLQDDAGFLSIWDMPGQRAFREKWLVGLQDSNIIIYMIDIANQRRFKESKRELWKILNRYELNGVPLIILGNKVDLIKNQQNGKTQEEHLYRIKKEIFEFFKFERISNRTWKFMFTSVKTNFQIENTLEKIFELSSYEYESEDFFD